MSRVQVFARYREGDIEWVSHICRGLRSCGNHPKWHIFGNRPLGKSVWYVVSPGKLATSQIKGFDSHAEAITYALKEATK